MGIFQWLIGIFFRDFSYNYFGIKTLERTYLLKIGGKVVERPQHMLMRVALGWIYYHVYYPNVIRPYSSDLV